MAVGVFRVPLLGDDGILPERFLPAVAPSDAATAQLLAPEETTATKDAVEAIAAAEATAQLTAQLVNYVAKTLLTSTLNGYVPTSALGALASDLEVANLIATRTPLTFYREVVYDGTAWANPAPWVTGGARRFISVRHANAPEPPLLTGTDGDLWEAHPDSAVFDTLAPVTV